MLRTLRFLLACCLLAALPLKGYTAASMVLCHPAQAAGAGGAETLPAHDGHALGHHSHGDPGGHPMQAAQDLADGPWQGAALGGADDHLCGVCALCCHALALSSAPVGASPGTTPRAPTLAPPAALRTRGLPVPDKPPRA